jgi:Domain of unknown function (DUF4214)
MPDLLRGVFATIIFTLFSCAIHAQESSISEVQTIARLYSASLDRPPRFDGLNFFVNSLESGRSVIGIAEDFVESDEFATKYGQLNDRQYVEQLFRNVLGRDGASTGIDFWVGNLADGSSRAFVLAQFADSNENVVNTDFLYGSMQFADGQWEYNRLGSLAEQFCPGALCIQAQLNGPLGGSQVVVTPLRNTNNVTSSATSLDESALIEQLGSDTWENLSRVDRLSLLGIVPVPAVAASQLYLISASGGFDYDKDLNNLADTDPSRLRGTVHAIVTGAQISAGLQLNALTEAAYQGVISSVAILTNDQISNRLDVAATQLLASDITGDGELNYQDVLGWIRGPNIDAYLGDIADVNKLAVAVGEGRDASSIGILSNRMLGGTAGLGLDETNAATIAPDGSCEGRGKTINNRHQESITTLPPSAACGEEDPGQVQSSQGNIAAMIVPDDQGLPSNMQIRSSTIEFSDVTPQSSEITVEYQDGNGNKRRGSVSTESVPRSDRLSSRYRSIQGDDADASSQDGVSVLSGGVAQRSVYGHSSSGNITVASAESDRFDDTVSEAMTYGALTSNWSACVVYQFVAQQEAQGEPIDGAVRKWAISGCSSVLAETDTWVAERTAEQIVDFEAAVPVVAPVGCTDCFSYIASPAGSVTVGVGEDPGFNGVAPATSGRVQWAFGNGETATSRAPVFSYAQPGSYTARFSVDYSDGSSGFDEVAITVVAAQGGCFKAPEVRATTSSINDPVTNADSIVFNTTTTVFGDNCQIEALEITQVDGAPAVDLVFNAFDQGSTSFAVPVVTGTTTLTFEIQARDSDGNVSTASVPVNLFGEGAEPVGDPAASIEGIWVSPDVAPENLHLIFRADGSYLLYQGFYFGDNVEFGDADYCAGGGGEGGTYQRSESTGAFSAMPSFDENGECGLSNPRGELTIIADGDTLNIAESGEENSESSTLVRYSSNTPPAQGSVANIVGNWTVVLEEGPIDLSLNFGADGSYSFLSATDFETRLDEEECSGGSSIDEQGSYQWDRATGVTSITIDTASYGECAGPRPPVGETFTINVTPSKDGGNLRVQTNSATYNFSRIP